MPLGVSFFDVIRVALEDVVGILIGHQSHGNFCRGFGRNYSLGAGCGESAGHAVHFQRGPRPGAIEHRESRLAGQHLGSDFSFAIVLFVERQPLPGFEFGCGRSLYL